MIDAIKYFVFSSNFRTVLLPNFLRQHIFAHFLLIIELYSPSMMNLRRLFMYFNQIIINCFPESENSLAESEMRQEQLEMRLVELRKEKDKLEHMKIDKNDDLDLKESNQKLLSLQAENDSLKLETVSLKEAMERGSKVIKDLERQV